MPMGITNPITMGITKKIAFMPNYSHARKGNMRLVSSAESASLVCRQCNYAECSATSIMSHICPNKIFENRRNSNPHAGYTRSAYQGGFNFTGAWIYPPRIVSALPPPAMPAQRSCAYLLHFVLRTSYLITPASSCLKITAHHEALIFLGTAVPPRSSFGLQESHPPFLRTE